MKHLPLLALLLLSTAALPCDRTIHLQLPPNWSQNSVVIVGPGGGPTYGRIYSLNSNCNGYCSFQLDNSLFPPYQSQFIFSASESWGGPYITKEHFNFQYPTEDFRCNDFDNSASGEVWIYEDPLNPGKTKFSTTLPDYNFAGEYPISNSVVYFSNQWLKSDGTHTTISSNSTPAIDNIVYEGKKLIEGTDYEILYNNARVVILSKGDYYGVKFVEFYITDSENIATAAVTSIPDQLWTGSEIKPEIIIKYFNEVILRENTDYVLSYSDNTNAGTATIQIVGIGFFYGTSKTATFKIVDKKELPGKATIPTSISTVTYDGTKHTPAITVTHIEDGSLTEGTDYIVSYGDNTNAGMGQVYAIGIGDYSGSISKSFTISPKSISTAIVAEIPAYEYTGSPIMPIVTLTDGTKTLILETDYTVAYLNNTNPTEYALINITGKGNYTGTKSAYFIITEGNTDIEKTDIAVAWKEPLSFVYNGEIQKPSATASRPDGVPLLLSISSNAVNARTTPYTATASLATINPRYNLTNNTIDFYITKAPIAATLNISNIKSGQTLSPSVAGNKGGGVASYWYSATEDGAYTQTAPIVQGIYYAKAVVAETGNYLGDTTAPVPFAITKANPTPVPVTWSGSDMFIYNGTEQSPGASASLGGTSFPVVVSGAVNAGTYTATARLAAPSVDYELSNASKEFTIVARPLPAAAIDPLSNYPFSGQQITPDITVRDGTQKLVEGIDYTVSYGSNISGTGTATATGMGNYSGTASRSFIISTEGATVVNVKWSDDTLFVYNGLEHCPAATTDGGYEVDVLGCQANAGTGYTAVAQLKAENPNIILGNASRPYTIDKKLLPVSWTPERKFTYNKMVQVPIPRVSEANVVLRVVNGHSAAGVYKGVLAPFAQIVSANASNYELSNHTIDEYEITKKGLKPYFAATLPDFSTNKADTLWVPYQVFADSAALHNVLNGLIDYDGFATDTINKASDDITALKGKPTVALQYPRVSPSMLQRRVETTQKATAIIVTDAVSADNYALTRPAIVIMATVEENENAEKVFCQLGGNCALFSEEVCSAIGGKSVESCSDIKVACVINAYCVETSIENCRNGGGTAIGNSCSEASMLRPQLSGGSLRIWQTASGVVNVDLGYTPSAPVVLRVYSIKGKLVATERVSTRFASVRVSVPSGVYLVKVGGRSAVAIL